MKFGPQQEPSPNIVETMYIDVKIVTTLWIEDTIFSGWEGGGGGRLGAKVESSRHQGDYYQIDSLSLGINVLLSQTRVAAYFLIKSPLSPGVVSVLGVGRVSVNRSMLTEACFIRLTTRQHKQQSTSTNMNKHQNIAGHSCISDLTKTTQKVQIF